MSLALTLTACADKNNDAEVSEVGKKYAVNNYKTDVIFKLDNSEREATDEEKLMYSTMWVSFKENNAVELFLHAGMPTDTRFYAVNSKNCVEFFDSLEDAKSMTNRLTDDYLGWNYQFDSSKKTLTVSTKIESEGLTLIMVLTCTNTL